MRPEPPVGPPSEPSFALAVYNDQSFLYKTMDMSLDPAIIKGSGLVRYGELPFAL